MKSPTIILKKKVIIFKDYCLVDKIYFVPFLYIPICLFVFISDFSYHMAWITYGYTVARNILDNNTSDKSIVNVLMPDYPTPTALKATSEKDGVALAWTAPDLENRNLQTTTDTFDNYEAFAINGYGDWTTYDCDQQNTIQITLNESFGPLQYKNAGKPMAFQVFNVEEAGIPFASWDPHS